MEQIVEDEVRDPAGQALGNVGFYVKARSILECALDTRTDRHGHHVKLEIAFERSAALGRMSRIGSKLSQNRPFGSLGKTSW